MAPRRKNREGDLPQTSVEEQVGGSEAAQGGGSSSNLAGEVAPSPSMSSADFECVLIQMMEVNRKMMLENIQ
ncbi:hypothetical protein LINGRAHAP2_LOCUS14273 [Linum grandiflorum]